MSSFLDEIRKIEHKWQKKWHESQIFVGKIDRSKPKYFVTVPYPYASGTMHIGHCRTYNLGDIFTRYKRQRGFNVLWPMAYHITGTPILSVSAKIKSKDEKEWKKYKDYVKIYEEDEERVEEIVRSFEEPMNVAMYFSNKLMEDFKRMGFSIDDTREFTTGDAEYNKFIEWQYKILNEKGYITKGNYPILWCTNCKNAVGEDDIQSGDEQKIEVSDFVGIKFKLPNGVFLVAATFRPETIFGATNVWIHPNQIYCEISIDGETWVVSKESTSKLKEQNHKIEIIKEFEGKELFGQEVEVPLTGEKIPIYPATFVDTDHATGVVYSVPGHAPYDYAALADLQKDKFAIEQFSLDKEKLQSIKPIALIKLEGYNEFPAVEICEKLGVKSQEDKEKLEKATQTIYKEEFYSGVMLNNTGEFEGLKVEQAKEAVAKKLKAMKLATDIYEVSSKAVCRCGGKIIAAVLEDQYFLNYGDPEWKKKAFEALNSMEIIPNKYRQGFENTFDWLDKRPCVRKRGLGTEFPITKGKGWIIESLSDSVIYMSFYTIIKQIRENKISAERLIPEFFDFVLLNKGDIAEVSKKTGVKPEVLKKIKEEFEYWYPNDLRHTAIAHLSNHLSFTIFHHAAIFPPKYWVKAFSLNEMLVREGEKMGKSKGNVIPIAHIPEKYSVDLTRLHLASVATPESVVDWREKEVNHSKERLRKFWDFATLVQDVKKTEQKNYSFPSKVVLASVKQNIKASIEAMEGFNPRDYILTGFFDNLRVIENYYKLSSDLDENEVKSVIREIIEKIVVLIAPVIPHVCEEIYERFGNDGFVSLAQISDVEITREDKLYALQAKFMTNLMKDIEQIVKLVQREPERIVIYIAPEWKNRLYTLARDTFKEEAFNIGKLMGIAKSNDELKQYMKEIADEAKLMMKDPTIFRIELLEPNEQKDAIEGYSKIISKKYPKAKIEIYVAEEEGIYDPQKKARKARPMKPALLLE
ncbi:MAG: leucine--tRNA ligase [Candidatus Heimdallarchaeaceae archaeon]